MTNNSQNQKNVFSEEPISVSEYISVLNEVLSRFEVKLMGEVSEVKKASSGHVYFSLKDEESGDVINCVIWRSIYRMCGVDLEEGMKVIVSGHADIYRVRGTLTFKTRTVEPAGEGALKKAYDKLKEKLKKEGFFSKERKRKLPEYPQRVGLITSKEGAAIHDFMNNLGKFGFHVLLCDSRVEGQEAVEDLLRSIKAMKKKNLDVLVIIRGGGSLQSLIAFDNENLIRELSEFPVPVITGIGHHEDVPLVALAADAAESTPTGVANRLSEGFVKAREAVYFHERNINNTFKSILHEKNKQLSGSLTEITRFFRELLKKYKENESRIKRVVSLGYHLAERKREEMNSSAKRIEREFFLAIRKKKEERSESTKNILSSFLLLFKNTKNKMEEHSKVIMANDPKKQLKLGYAIMKGQRGKVIKSVRDVKKGEETKTVVSDGEIDSHITNINKKNDHA